MASCRAGRLYFLLAAFLAQAHLKALEQICAGPQSAGAIDRNLSLTTISGYYWRLDPPYASLVTPEATGSAYTLGHTMGLGLLQGHADKLELLFPLDSVKGDPRKAKYSLKFQATGKTPGQDSLEVFARYAASADAFVESLNRQRTQIIFSPLNANAQLIGDASFLQVASLPVDADAAYETPPFLGESVARLEGGHWVLWVRLRVANPAATGTQETTNTVDLGQISLLCHFVEYPDKPLGPESAGIGENHRYLTRSSDNHGFPVEYRWVSIRYWSGLFQQGVIEQDWSPGSTLDKTWSLPGLYQLLVTARSGADPEVLNNSQSPLEILVTPPAPSQITYPSTSVTGKYSVLWTPSPQATSYDLERSKDGGSHWLQIASLISTAYLEDVGPGKYRYRVRACDHDDLRTEFCSGFRAGAEDALVSGTPAPSIRRSPDRLDFSAEEGGPDPPSQLLSVSNGGGGALEWGVSASPGWLLLSPSSGTTTGEVDEVVVSVDAASLPVGSHEGTITVSAPAALNSPQSTTVVLTVVEKTPPLEPPRAQILSILPSPADEGSEICFEGSGVDSDGAIEAFEWTSSIQGLLSREGSFCRSDLVSGLHAISFRVKDDDGLWSELVQRALLVGNRIAAWPLDDCQARDEAGVRGESGDRDGKIVGTVGCDADRFGRLERCLSFPEDGKVIASGLPFLEGDFSLRFWARLDEAPPGEGSDLPNLLEIRSTQARAAAPPLSVSWNEGASTLNVRQGEGVEIENVAPGWHPIVLSRTGGALAVFLDGTFSGILLSSTPLGDQLQMGGGFRGALDQAVYERRPLDALEVEAALLEGGPTVELRSERDGEELPAYPGTTIEGVTFRLRTSALNEGTIEGQPFQVKRLRVSGPSGFVQGGSLFLEQGSSGESPRTLLGRLEPSQKAESPSASPSAFDLAQVVPHDLPSGSEVKLIAQFELAPSAPIGERVQFSIQSPDDLGLEPAFVAGPRRVGVSAAEGRKYQLDAPPAVELAAAQLKDAGASNRALLHGLTLQVESVEDLVLESLFYRKVEGTTLDGVSDAALFLDKNLDGSLEPDEKIGEGRVDKEGGGIRFGGLPGSLGALLEAGSTASLFLVARLETVSRTTPVGSAFFFGAAFYLVLFAWLRRKVSFRRRLGSLQALVAALLLSAAVALEGGCGGGGGGKEARSSTGGALEVEVGLLRAEDVALRGSLTGAAVTLKGLPDGGLIGPRQKP